MEGELVGMDSCIYMAESLCYPPETVMLLIGDVVI